MAAVLGTARLENNYLFLQDFGSVKLASSATTTGTANQ